MLQQLGRGLRHAPGKDCLTVLDFVGQTHRRYRRETEFSVLLSRAGSALIRKSKTIFPICHQDAVLFLNASPKSMLCARSNRGIVDDEFITKLLSWRHRSGFSVHHGVMIEVGDRQGLEALVQDG
ncbi:MAG: hypothetical protein JW781_07720 [Deltaproteobacteria bacterium]|nr:hypothetical protein [Candidatus Anaeroferrophillacea bacterium]